MWARGVAQVAQSPPSNCQALSSIPSTAKYTKQNEIKPKTAKLLERLEEPESSATHGTLAIVKTVSLINFLWNRSILD
jgi:hypothetical protein